VPKNDFFSPFYYDEQLSKLKPVRWLSAILYLRVKLFSSLRLRENAAR